MEFRRIREIKESVKSEKEKLSDTQYWMKFLQTSSYHYKHSFDDQIMINLQNPQFTACSDARSWRSLSREPQGHGVPTLHNGKIRYLFDITQTSAPEGTPLPWVWEINDSQLNIDYSESVSKHLTEKYNLDSETLEEQLYNITLMRTAKYLNDDKSDLYKVVAESAAYSLLYRCCPGEAQPSPNNLTGLSKYPIEEIGQAVTEISKSIFLEIESIVRNTRHNAIEEIRRNEHNETRENDRRSETRSKPQDRGISSGYGNLKGMDVRSGRGEFPVLSDLSEGSPYRSDIGSGKERISGDGSGIGKTIGGGKRDSGIHRSGVRHSTGRNERELLQDGIGVLETDSGGTSSGDPSREVRNNAQELSSQSGHQGIYMAEKQRSTEQTSDSRQSSGTRNGRYDSGKTQGEQSGIQRSGESGRLPENSTASEQFSENSRGRNSDRTDIQIIGNTPYRYIPQKTYRKYDTDIAAKIADKLGESGIKFSGKITAETTTITVSKADIERLEEIAHSFTAEKEQFAIGELKITQDDIEILRSIEPRKSILNFTAEEIKLTETWQQRFETDIHEKSPYYRALNGDWRENDESKVTVIQVEDRNVTLNSVRNDIKSQVIERGTASNIDTGWNIQISRKGLEDTVHYANKHNDTATLNSIYNINTIVNNAILLDSVVSENNNDNKANNTAFMHKMYSVCKFNNEPYLAKLAVEEFAVQSDTLKRLYNVQDIKIEPLRHVVFTDLNQLAQSVLNGTEISIADLFKIVKASDKDFYINKRTDIEKEKFAIGELSKSVAENPMDRAIRLINEYCEKEFGSPGNFSNMDHIELAYKPDEETGLAGIEAYADLETFRIVKEQDGRVVDEQLFNSLDHMNTVLKNLDFDKLIELSDNDKSEIKTTVFENTEKKSPDVSELSVGDVILYDGKRRKVEQISENSISLKDLDAPDFGGILLGTSDVLAYNGWQQDMNEKGFEILSKAAPQITSKDHQYVPSQLSLFGEPVVYESDVEEKAIYAALMKGSGFQDGKFRIEEFIKENHSINELAKMLKDEYGTGGHSGNEFYAFANHNSKGIEIILNRKYDNEEGRKIYLSWKEVAERISELVSKGEYITKADIDDRIYHAKYILKYYDSDSESDKIHTERAKNILKEYGILPESSKISRDLFDIENAYINTIKNKGTLSRIEIRANTNLKKRLSEKGLNPNADSSDKVIFNTDGQNWNKFVIPDKWGNLTNNIDISEVLTADEYDEISYVISKVIPESEITFTKPDNNSHLKNNIEESDAKNPEENNKPDVPQKITVGDRFRHKITGNISEVVSLTGAFPWITDECTVTRDSGVFSVTENISYNQLLNSDLYEYIDHTDRTVERAKKSMKSDMKIENFKITGDFIIEGGAKSKFKANSEAIRTLKMIEKENRPATPEEQVILSRYVGWGGLSAAFDSKNEQWSAEYSELKSLLTDEEYNAARASVLDSFYTPPFIIESIYSALENMGFHGGSVLDPSTGTGNFLGKMPGSMSDNSRIYAVEKDSVSGRIAKLLYPDADIQITGFEKRDFSDNFFDVAVGNIPFGGFKISDRRYDKYNFAVHDYFIAKTLDKVRPGGVIAFITSSGTLDKANPSVRKYISQRAELLGAVRLPNNAFKSYAGTEVTSDIIFLRKREKMIDIAPDWVYTSKNPDGLTINNYFIENPEMILGKVVEGNKLYGKGTMVVPFENSDLKVILNEAVKKIKGNYTAEKSVIAKPSGKKKDKFKPEILPADPTVKNFSYAEIDGKIFYRENSIMTEIPFTGKRYERVSGIAAITKCVRELLNMQLEGYSDEAIISKRTGLNQLYDDFTKKNGLLNDKTNRDIFREDVSLPLVLSLEKVKDGKLIGKADIFTKRTLQPPVRITHADTAADALAVSISEKAGVDLDFMSELMDGKEKSEIISDLKGVIYLNPETSAWETADAYLSGNIRNKLAVAKSAAEPNPDFTENVSALEAAMPDRIEAGDISAKLGSPWIDDKYIQEFMYELFETPKFSRNLGIDNNYIGIQHNPATAKWNVMNKSLDKDNIKSNTAYGTSRKSGYSIFEDSLNLIDTTVYDPVYNPEKDKTEYVINHDETLLARQKQELIENAFREWIFKNPERREYLVEKYNVLYNSIRPREYDGSHLTFAGMNPEITLKKHQKDAVAHALYGGNTLFAHKVGAGKTYEMIAAAMEGKRLGLHNKSLLAVPNHMTEQFANDFLTLYPNANILIAHEDDFKKENRQKLCAKIATGEFDAIIIGHSQLIKIPVSKEREEQFIKDQINELINDIAEMKEQNAESFTVKDMERTKRDYEAKLKKLIEKPIKDDVVTFEEMGVDKLFIDEADMFKNLSVSTKMRNISGVAANRKVQKTQDLYIKCQYLDELTGGKGIVFATGTPVSNSITELFIMQKYLQADYLRESGLTHFDAWAANFAQKVTKLEYAPTGKGFRQKTRLSKFSNLPELMTAFKECADIKTAQDLNLPEPECERHIIAAEPTETQKNLIQSLSERAEKIHNKQVTPDVDNMLKVTTDGIKIGLDQRLINPLLPDEPNTKINMCVNNVTDIWKKTADERLTQVIFCDYSTPKKDAFNLYDDIKSKLIANGIPENEIAFIHDYEKPQDKERLFDKVRNGEIRIVLGSTQKMGAGTNIQNKLYAMHHLDAPWKPRDMEQRLGRMKRQGNMNDKVHEYIYVTKDTFDAYRFQTLETKQGFISQIMTSKNPVRVCEDVSQSEMEFAEVKALCAGNPLIREKMKIDIEVHKLQTLKSAYLNQRYKLEDNVLKHIPESIAKAKENLNAVLADSKITEQNPLKRDGEGNIIFSGMTINDHVYADKKEAGTALIEAAAKALTGDPNARTEIGQYRGFRLEVFFDALSNDIKMDIKGKGGYRITLSSSDTGNLTRIDNAINHIPEKIDEYKSEIEALNTQLENSKAELAKPFLKEQELKTKLARQSELDRQLNLDNKENLLGKDNVKSFELETEADRQKLNSHNSMQKKDIKSYDLEL